MQIQAIQSSSNNLNFGMAVKISPEAKQFIKTNFNDKQLVKLDNIVENQKNNKYDIFLLTEKTQVPGNWIDNGKGGIIRAYYEDESLAAYVKDRKFQKTLFSSTISMIKKAEKYADKLQKGEKPDVDKILSKADSYANKLDFEG